MCGQNTRHQKNTEAYKVFFLTPMLRKLFSKNYQVKIDMNNAKNAPSKNLAQPISNVYFSHIANLKFKIVKIRCVLINGDMLLWEVVLVLLKLIICNCFNFCEIVQPPFYCRGFLSLLLLVFYN